MNIVKLIQDCKYKEALTLLNDSELKLTHLQYDQIMEEIIDSLDPDEPDTFVLLNVLVLISKMSMLINVTEEEHKLYGVYNSRSPFDKLLDYYSTLDSDNSKEKRFVKGVIDLIRANIRYNSDYLVDYHVLKTKT